MLCHAFANCVVVTRAVEETKDAVAKVLVGVVEENLTIIAGAIKAIHWRKHIANIKLPAALEEVGNLVEQQLSMSTIDFHQLFAKATALAHQCDDAAEGTHHRRGEICRLDDGVDLARRLLDLDGIPCHLGHCKASGYLYQDLLLTFAIHHGTFEKVGAETKIGGRTMSNPRGQHRRQETRGAVDGVHAGLHLRRR
jgi:hypothetical protein